MDIHPNNTLAHLIYHKPTATDKSLRCMGVWAHRDLQPARLVQHARMVVEHEESVHNVFLDEYPKSSKPTRSLSFVIRTTPINQENIGSPCTWTSAVTSSE